MRVIIFLILIISFINAKKVALIIGISDYENYPKLSTPLNDVRDMNNALMDMGFKTLTLKNGSKSEFEQMIERFRKEASDAEIALIYSYLSTQLPKSPYPINQQASFAYQEALHG